MAERGTTRPRADAQRNREAVLAAADGLFAHDKAVRTISMDEVAAAAGVGKGTLFRHFKDRVGLIGALVEARITPLWEAIASGEPPLGPGSQPRERVLAILDGLLCFKLANRPLTLALEEAGRGSPYEPSHYDAWHQVLSEALAALPVPADDPDFTAHALLAAVRADLVAELTHRGTTPSALRAALAAHAAKVMD